MAPIIVYFSDSGGSTPAAPFDFTGTYDASFGTGSQDTNPTWGSVPASTPTGFGFFAMRSDVGPDNGKGTGKYGLTFDFDSTANRDAFKASYPNDFAPLQHRLDSNNSYIATKEGWEWDDVTSSTRLYLRGSNFLWFEGADADWANDSETYTMDTSQQVAPYSGQPPLQLRFQASSVTSYPSTENSPNVQKNFYGNAASNYNLRSGTSDPIRTSSSRFWVDCVIDHTDAGRFPRADMLYAWQKSNDLNLIFTVPSEGTWIGDTLPLAGDTGRQNTNGLVRYQRKGPGGSKTPAWEDWILSTGGNTAWVDFCYEDFDFEDLFHDEDISWTSGTSLYKPITVGGDWISTSTANGTYANWTATSAPETCQILTTGVKLNADTLGAWDTTKKIKVALGGGNWKEATFDQKVTGTFDRYEFLWDDGTFATADIEPGGTFRWQAADLLVAVIDV